MMIKTELIITLVIYSLLSGIVMIFTEPLSNIMVTTEDIIDVLLTIYD